MSLSVGIVGLPNVGPRTTLACSRGLHPRFARARIRGYSDILFFGGLSVEGRLYVP